MDAIGLNPIKLDAIGLDPIRMNAIRLGVPGASSDSARPYIDPELLSHVKMAISTWGKTNDDPDRAVLKDLTPNGNDMRLLNFGFAEGSGYGLPGTDFEGWLCTDGVDDIIESVKPVSEMLEGSNEITVVSIIHQISTPNTDNYTNVIRTKADSYGVSIAVGKDVSNGKTGIYGYTVKEGSATIINSILGDKADYTLRYGNINANIDSKFFVQGWYLNGSYRELSQIAYAGGFIANKVLTTDEINQIISYFNLDRPGQIIKPQLYYNIKKQGITNENHAEFNDQLIDFINGHNIQLNNIGWEGEGGINSYPVVFGANKTWETYATYNFTSNINGNELHITKVLNSNGLIFSYVKRNNELLNIKEIPSFDIEVIGLEGESKLQYYYLSEENAANITILTLENGVHKIPKSFIQTDILPNSTWIGFRITPIQKGVSSFDCDITIEVLPTIEHALCLDGINDFGKVTGLPVLKDYTVVADRKFLNFMIDSGGIVSKAATGDQGAFILEQSQSPTDGIIQTWTFGKNNTNISNSKITERGIVVQTKYQYNYSANLTLGSGIDQSSMWMGTLRDNDTRFSKVAIWSFLLYPYSMSEFLIERQLKKLKVGTLYPGMVQWKPLFESNLEYDAAVLTYNAEGASQGSAILGKYYPIGTKISIGIKPKDTLAEVSKLTCNGEELKLSNITNQGYYIYYTTIDKVPQRIDITIDEYIRYEDILQVYPTVVHFTNEDGTYEYTWGDKIKVGSKIKYKKYENLLPDFYTIKGALYFDGQRFGEANKYGTVTKTSTFSWSDKFLWKLSTPEALFMYDPAMINNAGLNNLGYLPDITGQGRHLKLNNFTYEGMSGKDGYLVVFGEKKTWTSIRSSGNTFVAEFESCLINVKKVDFGGALTYTYIKSNGILTDYNKDIPSFKVKIQGLNGDFGIKYTYIDSESSTTKQEFEITKDGTYTLPKSYAATDSLLNENVWIGFNCFDLRSVGHYDCNVSISVVPEYTGALCFDGVEDRGIVENIAYGGKYLGIKTNWKSKGAVIYDQRKAVSYTGLCVYLPGTIEELQFPAYQTRNQDGYTYIDSVLNKYITTAELYAKTHVFETICETDNSSNTVSPVFGSTVDGSHFSQFAMYRTVVLPEVPSDLDREILCGWLGTSEGYVEKPEYYWDAYGKTNDEGDSRVNILEQVRKQSGVSQDNMFLRNQNIAYNETSGYGGGYLFNFNTIPVTVTKVSNTDDTLVISRDSTTDQSWVVNLGKQNKEFELYVDWEGTETPRKLIWSKTTEGVATTINTMILNKGWNIVPVVEDDYTSIYLTQQSIGQTTIKQKRIYHDGLVLDGIDDYIECTNIPAFTDYTYIIKYVDFNNPPPNSCIQRKGNTKLGGGAFVHSYISADNKEFQLSFGKSNENITNSNIVQYCTKTNYNGITITSGTNTDDLGFTIGKWNDYRKMVFYKEMLWSKTIDPLSIGMIRNLMEQDEIIDLKNKLFKKDVVVVSSVNNETSISNDTLIKNE